MNFLRRLVVVALVAGLIVGTGWGLKHVDAINAFFQKDGSGEHVEGADSVHIPKPGESRSDAPTALKPTGDPIDADTKQDSDAAVAGDESVHPADDEGKQDDTTHERWPALQFQDASHALQIMLPIITGVVVIDQVRRRRRKAHQLLTRPAATSLSDGAN